MQFLSLLCFGSSLPLIWYCLFCWLSASISVWCEKCTWAAKLLLKLDFFFLGRKSPKACIIHILSRLVMMKLKSGERWRLSTDLCLLIILSTTWVVCKYSSPTQMFLIQVTGISSSPTQPLSLCSDSLSVQIPNFPVTVIAVCTSIFNNTSQIMKQCQAGEQEKILFFSC